MSGVLLDEAARWRQDAACYGLDTEAFYGVPTERQGERMTKTEIARAKRICGGCPVIVQCRAWALARNERFGVWGGMTPAERHLTLASPAAAARQGRHIWAEIEALDREVKLPARVVAEQLGCSSRMVYKHRARLRARTAA